MAVIQKTLFAKNLDRYTTLVNDTETNSKYFKVTELPDTFTGGKNAFLVAGSKELVPDTKIQIELRDAAGNIIYHEPGEGYISSSLNGTPFVTEYYEGVSKVVSVYVYPDTAYGPCTLTILGELSEYTDANGIVVPVGLDWENKYNVKWTKTINVNPALANTTKIRFYQRPQATITEILSPIYKIENDLKVASAVTQSFANIKLSKLETFAGDVKRVKVFRTSQGDISDFDLIQDILVESKELLTSYGLSGSVVGQTGILTSETLKNYWNTGSLNAYLTSSRVESGVRLTGSGYFTYTSSLDIKSANTYELNLDAFYSSSTSSNLGVYLSWVSQSTTFSSSIATLVGTTPTKNLLDTVVPFKIDTDYPTASLYFSQSQGEWHLGNISLKLSQDTAFSPDEISFVTTMPTVLGNETFNFKFEFYDVNNNYVPVAVTQSATFNGGNTNIGGTILLISSSTSQSLADLNRVSSSISGTVTFNSSSISTSVGTLSGSVSGSITTLSSSVSGTISTLSSSVSSSNVFILSSSLSKTQQLADGKYSGSFIGDTVIYSPTIGGQQGYISSLFKVGTTPSIYLDARQSPRKIFIGGAIPSGDTEYSGAYNNSNTNVYLDSTGKFSLGNKLSYSAGVLSVTGQINIEAGGNAASTTDASNAVTSGSIAATNAALSGSNAATRAATSASAVDAKVFTDSTGKLSKTPSATASGLYLGSTYLGYYNGTDWKTYMSDTGNFYLSGTGTNSLTWNGNALSINGDITATNITATTAGNIAGWGISNTTLGTSRLKLNSSRPAMEIYDTTGQIVVDISTADTLSARTTATLTPSPTSISARTTVLNGVSFQDRYGYKVEYGTDSTIYTHAASSTFSVAAGDLVGKSCTIKAQLGTPTVMSFEVGGDDGPRPFTIVYQAMNCRVGFKLTAPDSTVTYVYEDKTNSYSTQHLNPYTLTITPSALISTAVTLQAGTYTITPFITNIFATATMTSNNDAAEPAVFSVIAYTPYLSSIAASVPVSKTEMIAGGFQVVFDSDKYIRIPRAANDDFVQIGGGLTCTGDVTANTSDIRLKENIRIINNPLEKIENIRGVYFNYTDDAKIKTGYTNAEEQVGFIAQEVQSVLPHIVKPAPFDKDQATGKSISGENYLTIQYEKIVPLLLEGIKELKKEIEELKKNR